jgi:type IV secretory pathway VirB10-like protein
MGNKASNKTNGKTTKTEKQPTQTHKTHKNQENMKGRTTERKNKTQKYSTNKRIWSVVDQGTLIVLFLINSAEARFASLRGSFS